MRVPRDQGLFFTVFFAVCLMAIAMAWLLLPVHHTGEQEAEDAPAKVLTLKPAVTPEERVQNMEKAVSMVSGTIDRMEEKKEDKKDVKKEDKKAGKKEDKKDEKVK
jgi:hypothetical protein